MRLNNKKTLFLILLFVFVITSILDMIVNVSTQPQISRSHINNIKKGRII